MGYKLNVNKTFVRNVSHVSCYKANIRYPFYKYTEREKYVYNIKMLIIIIEILTFYNV